MRTDAMTKQVGGDHYKKHMGMQVWDIVDEYELNFYEASALKYLLRSKGDRIEDLQKLIHYAEKEIENQGRTPRKEAGYARGGYVPKDDDYDKLLLDDEHQENIDKLNQERAKAISIQLEDDGSFIVDCNGYDYDTVIEMLKDEFKLNESKV